MRAPTIQQYLPLDEHLPPPPTQDPAENPTEFA